MSPSDWLEKMRQIWLHQTPDLIAGLLAEECEYHEDPLSPPLENISDIVAVWQEIKTQNIDYVEIDILHEHNNTCTAKWRFKEKDKTEHVGCYFLILDTDGKCVHFRQWWNS